MDISIIDIGTKSLKHYIFKILNGDKQLLHYKRYSDVNLGGENNLSSETEQRLLVVLKECLNYNNNYNVSQVRILGTEFFRSSEHAKDLVNKIENETGFSIEILDQEKEALYLYKGFVGLIDESDIFAAVNIGGGSTEVVVGNNAELKHSQKLSFGVNFLKNNFGGERIDWTKLDEYLENNINYYICDVKYIFVTGVLDFLNEVAPKLNCKFENNIIAGHKFSLSMENYQQLVNKLRQTPIEKLRSFYPKDPDFANNVAIGQSVYLKVAKKLNANIIIPSNNDLTDGLIRDILL